MKKIFAILMALVLTFAMSAVAFADSTPSVTLEKKYTENGANASAPGATFEFEISYDGYKVDKNGNLDATTNKPEVLPTISSVTFTGASDTAQTVNISTSGVTYPKVGYYYYTIKEKTPDAPIAGITYDDHEMKLVVSVMQGTTAFDLTQYIYVMKDGEKTYTCAENVYTAGSLKVTKIVAGSLGDTTVEYPVTVTLTSTQTVASTITVGGKEEKLEWKDGKAEIHLQLTHNDPVTISNIPAGVSYTVVEDGVTTDENGKMTRDGHDVAYTGTTGTMDASTKEATITNTKAGQVDTGITMDSIPYIVLLAVAVVGIAALTMKKRYEA